MNNFVSMYSNVNQPFNFPGTEGPNNMAISEFAFVVPPNFTNQQSLVSFLPHRQSTDETNKIIQDKMYSQTATNFDRPLNIQPTDRSYCPQDNFNSQPPPPRMAMQPDASTQSHTKSKDSEHKCKYCGKTFRRAYNLSRHLMVHSGEKPYVCSICQKPFSQQGNLTTHMSLHSGEKPYKCSVCNKTFRRSSYLDEHMLHHSGDKPHKCSQCPREFTRASHLTEHMRIHTGEKPYQCDKCERRFSRVSHLRSHKKMHDGPNSQKKISGPRPYGCGICDREFHQPTGLIAHMRRHTLCNECHDECIFDKPRRRRRQ